MEGEIYMIRAVSAFLAAGYMAALLSGCTISGEIKAMDQSKIHLLQFTDMAEGEEIAVVTTTKGQFTMRLFPSEAPKTVENFVTLSRQGYYDGKPIYQEQEDKDKDGIMQFISGAGETGGKGEFTAGDKVKAEYSCNLAQFPGAVTAYQPGSSSIDSRFYIVGSHQVDQETLDKITRANYPQQIVEKFEEVGGYPENWLNASIFGQVIEGQEVVDEIIACSKEETNSDELKIVTIEIKRYELSNND